MPLTVAEIINTAERFEKHFKGPAHFCTIKHIIVSIVRLYVLPSNVLVM
jgi:hypothetical protein